MFQPSGEFPKKSANFSQAEIDKFGTLAASWWDLEGEFKPLHAINPLRLGWIQSLAGDLRDKQVLDVGCGGGILAESMALSGAVVTGIDLAEKSLQVAHLHGLETGVQVNYQPIAVEVLAQQRPNTFDVVTCMEMLEHVPDPASIIHACANLAKLGGWVFFSTLNRNLKSFLYAIIGAEYVLRLLPRGTHSYENFITPSELGQDVRDAELRVQALRGLRYNPLTKIYYLSANTSVNYLMATRKS